MPITEFIPQHLSGPIRFVQPTRDDLGHMFNGLPLETIAQLGIDGQGGRIHYFNHFHRWEGPIAEGYASGWTLTDATGASTVVLGDVREGAIILTADATAGADTCLQLGTAITGKNFGYTVGKRLWCFARLKTSTIAAGWKFFLGFGTPTTTPGATAPTNGIFLRNGTAVGSLDLVAKEGANSTAKTSQCPLVANVYTIVGFTVDLIGHVHLWQDGVELTTGFIRAGSVGLATLDGDATKTLQFMVDKLLASSTLTVDWLLIGQDV